MGRGIQLKYGRIKWKPEWYQTVSCNVSCKIQSKKKRRNRCKIDIQLISWYSTRIFAVHHFVCY